MDYPAETGTPYPPNLIALERQARYALVGDFDGLDEALLIEVHFIDAGNTMVCVGFAEWASMINDEPFVTLWDVQDRMVARTGRNRRILLQNFADAFERSERRGSNCVGHRIIGTGPTAFGPHEIVDR